MKLINSLETRLPLSPHPISITIGNYDGLHIGHQTILSHLNGKTKILITFSNHPADVLRKEQPLKRICSPAHKLKLLEQAGIDYVYLIPFTLALSELSPRAFLETVRNSIPFDQLVLGEDAKIGKNRAGTKEVVQSLAEEMGFSATYIPDVLVNGVRPSSRLIRNYIQSGQLKEAEKLLGRPYSLLPGQQTDSLCLPPMQRYKIVQNGNVKELLLGDIIAGNHIDPNHELIFIGDL